MATALVFNRASDNYLFHGSQFKAGSGRDFLRLSTANNEAIIDLCNNSNIDISATDVFINGNRVVTSSGTSASTFGSLEVTGTTVLQDLSAGATDISSTLNVDGAVTLSSTLGVTGATTLTGALDANSTADIADTLTLSKVSGTGLSVTADASVGGTLDVTGAVQIGSGQNGSLTIGSGVNGGKIHSTATQHELVIDPFALDANGSTEDASGVVTILGNLVVRGNTTTFHSANVDVSDVNLTIASGTNVTSGMADGAGITVGNDAFATFKYVSNGSKWSTNISLDVSGNTDVAGALAVTGDTTLTGALDANSTADIADTLTLSRVSGTGLSVTADASVGGSLGVTGATTLTGALDANSTADIADTLTLSRGTGIGLTVTADASVGGTLGVVSKITATGGLDISGNLLPTTNDTQIPVTKSTFTLVTSGLGDLSGTTVDGLSTAFVGSSGDTTFHNAGSYTASRIVLSGNSLIKMEFKVNFISSPEADQTISFRVRRTIGATTTIVFKDENIGSNMGVTFRNVYNGTFIDDLGAATPAVTNNTSVTYQLQYKRNCPGGDTISTPFGIVTGGNYIFLQELYCP